jgi:hypothetical protein
LRVCGSETLSEPEPSLSSEGGVAISRSGTDPAASCLLPPLLRAATPWPLSPIAILKVRLGVALVIGIDLDPDVGAREFGARGDIPASA